MIRALVLAVFGLGLLGAGAGALWLHQASQPPSLTGEARAFEIPSGASLSQIARSLEQEGLIRDARVFEWIGRLAEAGTKLRAGEYLIPPTLSASQVLERLVRGEVRTYEVVIPPGLRAREIADRLAQAELVDREAFLTHVMSAEAVDAHGVEGPNLEGYLYPDTYRLARGLETAEVAGVLVEHFQSAWAEVAGRAEEQGLSMQEVVTLASIVEKETAAPEERPLIAAVFRNRMQRGMRLETDPTVIYGIADFDGNLRRVHLEDRSNPYNTYAIRGLPPGPIASPGREALEAVVAPAETDYLFFVSRNDGTHKFSVTYAEHAAAVDEYQRRRRTRSPR